MLHKKLLKFIFLASMMPLLTFASVTNGTIDSVNKYAKGLDSNVRKINFGLTAGNVQVTDTLLTGYAWSETSGWINLSPTKGGVTNTPDGVLSGYAWGQNTGWINFAPTKGGVTIDSTGFFHGYAWSQNMGWISFNCADNSSCGIDNYKVQTDWRPASTRPSSTQSSNTGSGGSGVPVSNTPSVTTYGATNITDVGAALNGYVNPNGSTDTVRWFEWGTSPANLSNQTTHYKHGSAPDGFSDAITGLSQNTPYYFRAVAQNSYGTVAGYVLNFTVNPPAQTATVTTTPPVAPVKIETPSSVLPQPTNPPIFSGASGGSAVVPVGINSDVSQGGGSASGEEAQNQKAPIIFAGILNITSTTTDRILLLSSKIISVAKENIVEFVNTPAGATTAKTIGTAGVVGGGAAGVVSVFGSIATLSDIPLVALRIWSLLLVALGLRKRRVPWGTVYDSVTKQPLDPAYVVLEIQGGKEAGTAITDLDGRFGFLTQPGSYHFIANKTNYSFPSKKLFGKTNDELYDNLYFGGEVSYDGKDVIAKNIPMDPEAFDWNEFAKRDKKLMTFYSRSARIITNVSIVLFYAGLVSSVVLYFVHPDKFNLAIVSIYGVLLILRMFGFKPKSYGVIIDTATKEPLSFAVVRVFQKGVTREMFHRITDQYGRYYALLAKGEYYVTIERKNSDESYTPVFTSDTINAKKGIIDKDFMI